MTRLTPNGVLQSTTDLVCMEGEVAEWCVAKGWADDGRTFGDELILIASELVEALEAFREHSYEEWVTYQPHVTELVGVPVKMPKMTVTQLQALNIPEELWGLPRREGVAPELAGTFVRLLDSCGRHGFNLGEEFRKEMDYNWTHTFRHGGRAL
jgi:hypothetical protein